MLVLFFLCFTILVEHGFTHSMFPEVLETAIEQIRPKREASCGGSVYIDAGGTAEIQLETELYNGTEFYLAKKECIWDVKTMPNHYMIIKSEYFSLEDSPNCVWDFVEITEHGDSGVTSRFCGWDKLTYITASSEITLRFKSDVSYEDKGFKLNLLSKDNADVEDSKCDSSIIGGEHSRIMNQEGDGKGCLYRIQAPEHLVVELNLKMLDFGSATCEAESVVVYEGLATHGEPLVTICSDSVQQILPYHANMMFIEYRNPLKQEGQRFMIEYSFVEYNPPPTTTLPPSPVGGNSDCSGMFKGTDAGVSEFMYTAPEYANNKECIVVVRNDQLPGHCVQIEFLYFDTEDSENCMFDSLRIMSGERNDSAMIGGPYCGESLRDRTFVTSGNSLRLEFRTDVSLAFRGFKSRITFVPTRECTCEQNNQMCIRQSYEKICIRGKPCTASTCQNGGTCVETGSKQTCYCRVGFRGDDCSESDEDPGGILHFTIAPVDRSLKRGESHIEECAVEAPQGEVVEYHWTLNGALIEAYNSHSGFGTHVGGVLQIDTFTDQHEGQYSCFASTTSATAEHTFEYKLVEDCDVRIYPGPQSERKKVTETALMICRVDSRAKHVRWKKDGVYIDFDNNPRLKQMTNNYLLISNIGMSDAGIYACEAEDNYGCYSYKEGTLTVIDVQPLNKFCGLSVHDQAALASTRITKGHDARPRENPWHVTFNTKNNRAFCGGTLISQKYVLTAAHCIEEFEDKLKLKWESENVYFLLGTTNCYKKGGETIRTFKSYTIHPEYGKAAIHDSDIALIELDSPVEYTDSIRPICLEHQDYNDRVFLEDSDSLSQIPGKVAGCGKLKYHRYAPSARQLQVIHLPYVRRERCEESLEKTNYRITENMYCAGSDIGRTGDTCTGDSGGGLVMAASGRWIQTGIVSWAVGGCDTDKYYGVYTNVGMFYDWIDGITKFSEEEVPDFLGQF